MDRPPAPGGTPPRPSRALRTAAATWAAVVVGLVVVGLAMWTGEADANIGAGLVYLLLLGLGVPWSLGSYALASGLDPWTFDGYARAFLLAAAAALLNVALFLGSGLLVRRVRARARR